MTNEQAIRILEGNKNFYERIVRPYDCEMVEALNMAIKALEDDQRYQEMQKPTGGHVVPDMLQGWKYQEDKE